MMQLLDAYTIGLTIPLLTASTFGGMNRSLWRISGRVNLVSGDGLVAFRVLVFSGINQRSRRAVTAALTARGRVS